jgi:hypothetical protein
MTPFPATVLPGDALSGTNACLIADPRPHYRASRRPGGMAPRASGEAREGRVPAAVVERSLAAIATRWRCQPRPRNDVAMQACHGPLEGICINREGPVTRLHRGRPWTKLASPPAGEQA